MIHYYTINSDTRCRNELPTSVRRVYFERTNTGGSTIYLFHNKVDGPGDNLSLHAFGWISATYASEIRPLAREGWCNFYPALSKALDKPTIVFTDDLTEEVNVVHAAATTNFERQTQHWKEPFVASTDASPQTDNKEVTMGEFNPYSAAAEQQARLSQKGNRVSNLKQTCTTALSTAVDNNKAAAGNAAYLTAGKIANDQVTKLAAGHLPLMVRGYANTPVGKLVTANIAQMLIQHFKPSQKAANRLAEAMVTQAYAELIATAGVEEFVDGLLSDPKIAKAMKAMGDD